jgi:hypothetical protein
MGAMVIAVNAALGIGVGQKFWTTSQSVGILCERWHELVLR